LGPWRQNVSHATVNNLKQTHLQYVIHVLLLVQYLDICFLSREKPQDLFNAMGSMYGASLFIGFVNAISVQPVVAVERTVFYRERAAGMYSAFPYAFGQVKCISLLVSSFLIFGHDMHSACFLAGCH
jgi:ABC-type transporter Mla maintaining outer membrane lipid asymmetry permease subunit MlaE